MSAAAIVIPDEAPVVAEATCYSDGGASRAGNGGSQSRTWMFTINNPDHVDGTIWSWLVTDRKFEIEAGVCQMEVGAEGTPHMQGFFRVKGKLKRQACMNKFRGVGWIDICKDIDKCILYCSKEETRTAGPFWFGDLQAGESGKTQGRRTDLKRFASAIIEGEPMEKLARDDPVTFVRNTKGLYALQQMVVKPVKRDFMTKLYIKWGRAGCGKSHSAFNDFGDDIYVLPKAKAGTVFWWPRYAGQEVVVIDDYDGWIDLQELKKIVDKYPYQVRESQDRWVEFTSKVVVITSNMMWTTWYATEFMKAATQKEAFERRITECKEYDVPFAPNNGEDGGYPAGDLRNMQNLPPADWAADGDPELELYSFSQDA